jgi:toluene monooxygenase system protein D
MTRAGVGDERVGPVLQATPFASVIVAAIEEDNDDVVVHDEGAYLRVEVPHVCQLRRTTLEAAIGQAVSFPGDLEVIMSSFAGSLRLTETGATWWFGTEPAPEVPLPPPQAPLQ